MAQLVEPSPQPQPQPQAPASKPPATRPVGVTDRDRAYLESQYRQQGYDAGAATRRARQHLSGTGTSNWWGQGSLPWDAILSAIQGNSGAAGARTNLWGAQQRYNLGMQGIDLERSTLNRQLPLLGARFGLDQRRFNLQGRGLGLEQGRLGDQRGYARYQATRALQEEMGRAAQTGGVTTAGHARRNTDIKRALADELGDLKLRRQQIGLERRGLRLDRKESRLLFREDKAKVRDGLKALDLRAKELGISLEEARRRLGDALQGTGLSGALSAVELIRGLGAMAETGPDGKAEAQSILRTFIG